MWSLPARACPVLMSPSAPQREAQTQAELIGNSVYSLVEEVEVADKDLVAANAEVGALADVIANFTSVLLVHAERRQFLMSGDEYVGVKPSLAPGRGVCVLLMSAIEWW